MKSYNLLLLLTQQLGISFYEKSNIYPLEQAQYLVTQQALHRLHYNLSKTITNTGGLYLFNNKPLKM